MPFVKNIVYVLTVAAVVALTGCAQPGYNQGYNQNMVNAAVLAGNTGMNPLTAIGVASALGGQGQNQYGYQNQSSQSSILNTIGAATVSNQGGGDLSSVLGVVNAINNVNQPAPQNNSILGGGLLNGLLGQ